MDAQLLPVFKQEVNMVHEGHSPWDHCEHTASPTHSRREQQLWLKKYFVAFLVFLAAQGSPEVAEGMREAADVM